MRSAGGADALPAHGDQRGRPGDAVGELVDVDVARFQLGEDPLQLGEGAGVAELAGRRRRSSRSVIVNAPRSARGGAEQAPVGEQCVDDVAGDDGGG